MPEPIIELVGVKKSFGPVSVLKGVDLKVYPGQVTALVGDNGAGKSTLIKGLAGVQPYDEGEVRIDGEHRDLTTPRVAGGFGIEVVYQDLALAAELQPAANLYLGREIMRRGFLGKLGFLDDREMKKRGDGAFHDLGVRIQDTNASVAAMSGGQRQGVAVARAVMWANRVVFMDEPTAALGVVQTRNVLDLIKRVRERGIAVVLISHNMPEVLEVADRVEVLRLGRRVARFERGNVTMEEIVGAMTGAIEHEKEKDA